SRGSLDLGSLDLGSLGLAAAAARVAWGGHDELVVPDRDVARYDDLPGVATAVVRRERAEAPLCGLTLDEQHHVDAEMRAGLALAARRAGDPHGKAAEDVAIDLVERQIGRRKIAAGGSGLGPGARAGSGRVHR